MPADLPIDQPGTFQFRLSQLPPSLRALLPDPVSIFGNRVQRGAGNPSIYDPSVVLSLWPDLEGAAGGPDAGSQDSESIPSGMMIHTMVVHARALESDFLRFGFVECIDDAIAIRSRILALTPDDHADRSDRLLELGVSFLHRSQHTDDLSCVDKAINCLSQAIWITPDGHEDKPLLLNNLGSAYLHRFGCLGELANLEIALECQTRGILLTPNDHSSRPGRLNNLGSSYITRFKRLGELADLEKAEVYLEEAVLLTDDSHVDRPTLLDSLACTYLLKSGRHAGGELAYLNRAIEYRSQVVRLVPDGHPHKPGWLYNLGAAYQSRFGRLGEIADIDAAIEWQSRAVSLTDDGHADKPDMLKDLGTSYLSRFRRLDERADVDKAVMCQHRALLLTPDGHARRPGQLNSLGTSYSRRFERFGDIADIEKAIESHAQAVTLSPDDDTEKRTHLSELGNSYVFRFWRLDKLSDIDKAIECHNQSLLLTPDGDVDKPAQLINLATAYGRRFVRFGQVEDIDNAIACYNQASLLTHEDHTRKLALLNNLGVSYSRRYERFGELKDAEAAHSFFQQAAQLMTINPRSQIFCAHAWAEYSSLIGASPQQAYQRMMELVPHLAWLGTTINRRYSILMEIGDLAMEAASWAISVKDYDRALEWLEGGRSVVWNQILQLRAPVDNLAAFDPSLAKHLEDVGRELEHVSSRSGSQSSLDDVTPLSEQEAQRHHHLAAEWHRLLEAARQIPGFSDFMRPHSADALRRAAKDGPVVIINIHQSTCDALVIRPEQRGIAHIPLSRFSHQKATHARIQLFSLAGHRGDRAGGFGRRRSEPKHEETFKAILSTLWWDVVKPVLDFLGYTHKLPFVELSHITWCTTGVLSFLPLHAAGCYDGLEPGAMDLVVSSYAPTLSALLASSHTTSDANSGILAVGQAWTKGLSLLPNTVKEVAAIKEQAKSTRFLQLDGSNATVNAVLDAMGKYNWVHLACHASQNEADPAQSAFHLHDGALTLSEITKRSFKDKGLAFLSACQTAAGHEKLADEAVHLAAGMLVAGYPSVIATLWAIHDEDAPEVAQDVYAELLKDGSIQCTGASRALHKAVVALREKTGESSFERWVPFIHVGS